MESEEEVIKKGKNVSCIQCKTTGLFTLDTIFMIYCNDCFVNKKEEYKLEWFAKMTQVLLSCEVCLESYTVEKPLAVHSCNRKGVVSCEHCGQQFYSWKSTKKHCKIVHNLVIDSRDCVKSSTDNFDKQNSSSNSRNFSLVLVQQTDENPYQCATCGKSFSKKKTLVIHTRCHTGEKPYRCPICSKRFAKRCNCVNHVRSHTGEKPYQCPTCRKSFRMKCGLVSHIRCHTGEKPYRCPKCDKSFTQKTNLVAHTRCHTGEKPFQCSMCRKNFRQKAGVIAHIRCRTGEKPYRCSLCSRSFANKSGLVSHTHSHAYAAKKPFVCKLRGKGLLYTSSLNEHTCKLLLLK